MTKSTITRERLEWLSQISCRDDIEDIGGDEIRELARMALAAMDSEPVALQPELAKVIYHFRDWNEGFPVERFKADYVISWMLANYPPAQPAPVVPDAATAIRACLSEFPESARDIVEECADIAENACRAAMLNGGKS